MKLELSIKVDYLPSWGLYEGLRELIQNGADAATEFDAPLKVRHFADSSVLVIENTGCTLPHEALLLGHTSKDDRHDLIGKFGEGFKLGSLALVRSGHPIKIRSGDEVWIPTIQRSEKFKANVLVFDITKGREPKERVLIEIGNVPEEEWETMRECFLFLQKTKDEESVKTRSGTLLLSDRFKGKVYVKGIFVMQDPKLAYGYNLTHAEIDRDRRMLERYNLNYHTQCVWREAMGTRPDLIAGFMTMLDSETADVEGVDEYHARNMPEEVKLSIAAEFTRRHGDDALPVSSLADSQDIGHFGKRGIVTPKALRCMLEAVFGTIDTNKLKLAEETVKIYQWHELEDDEQRNLQRAIDLIHPAEPISLDTITIADFRDPGLHGLFKDGGPLGSVTLAKKILADRDQTLQTLVHEVSHRVGVDGSKGHVAKIERTWSSIVSGLS